MAHNKSDILEKCVNLFLQYGIKSLTMDYIAQALHISKKTLYQHFKDKSDLVCQAMKAKCEVDRNEIEEIVNTSSNAIDELLSINNYFSELLQSMHPSIHFDLDKYYNDAWRVFNEHRNVHLKCITVNNLEKGIESGLYRKDLNTEIIAQFYIARIDLIFNATVFPTRVYKFNDVQKEMLNYHIRGIASEKGIRYFETMSGRGRDES
ncbi:MAG: TetR/AcrR family transcriptional regulator [Flavobacteriales bacterium]